MVPKHNFTLWTSYDVMPKLTLGAGATVMSQTYASVSATTKKWTPGYARFDAAATWRVNKTMDVQLNAQNLFDKSITRRVSDLRDVGAGPFGDGHAQLLSVTRRRRAGARSSRRTHHGSEYVFTFVKLFIASCTPLVTGPNLHATERRQLEPVARHFAHVHAADFQPVMKRVMWSKRFVQTDDDSA